MTGYKSERLRELTSQKMIHLLFFVNIGSDLEMLGKKKKCLRKGMIFKVSEIREKYCKGRQGEHQQFNFGAREVKISVNINNFLKYISDR